MRIHVQRSYVRMYARTYSGHKYVNVLLYAYEGVLSHTRGGCITRVISSHI